MNRSQQPRTTGDKQTNICQYAERASEKLRTERQYCRHISNDFTGSGVSQLQLFDERPPRPHSSELMKVLDGINHSGLGQVWFAGRGIAPSWQMKRDMLSPAYTTRWKDIPIARVS